MATVYLLSTAEPLRAGENLLGGAVGVVVTGVTCPASVSRSHRTAMCRGSSDFEDSSP